MLVYKSYKVELKPNNAQRTLFAKHAGTARFTFNWGVAEVKTAMDAKAKIPTSFDLAKRLNSIKRVEFPWMLECSKHAPQNALHSVEAAFKNFFARCKQRKSGSSVAPGFPKFKKKGVRDSFTLGMSSAFEVTGSRICLPKIGWLRLKQWDFIPVDGVKFLSATVSRKADRWFVSVATEQEVPDPVHPSHETVGVDLGISTLATCSDGTAFFAPKPLKKHLRKLKRLSRSLSRKQKGSKNKAKARLRLSRLHLRISNIRRDSLHKITTQLTRTKSRVVIEDLNVKGMVQNRKLSRAISDLGFFEFRRQLEYKGKWRGCEIVVSPRFFPSSKTCSGCGSVKDELQLSERTHVCGCGLEMDRDLNAALNLKAVADRQSETLNACGGTTPLVGEKSSLKCARRSRKRASRKGNKS